MTPLILPFIIPLVTASLSLVSGRRWDRAQPWLNLVGCIFYFIAAMALGAQVWRKGIQTMALGDWQPPFGIVIVADTLSASMVGIAGFVGLCVALYAMAGPDSRWGRGFWVCFQTLILGVTGAFLTGDLFNLYVWFEVMLISSFAMMGFEGGAKQIEGTLKYTYLNLTASMFFLVAAGLIYSEFGTLNMADLSWKMSQLSSSSLVEEAALVLLLIAFGSKAGLFPLYSWLPSSYHTTSTVAASLFAGLLTKVGVYTLIRTYTLIFPRAFEATGEILLVVAGLTMFFGVIGATTDFNVRRILSFHIISQIGYIVLGLAIFTKASMAAAAFYIIHHIFVKTNLFLVSGLIQRVRGTLSLKNIGGLLKSHPGLSFLFGIPALSLAGIPPFSGFFAKFLIIKAGFEASHYQSIFVALIVSLLTVFSMSKIWSEGFWKSHPDPESSTRRISWWQYSPVILMALITIIIGLFPQWLLSVSDRISGEILDPRIYQNAVLNGGP